MARAHPHYGTQCTFALSPSLYVNPIQTLSLQKHPEKCLTKYQGTVDLLTHEMNSCVHGLYSRSKVGCSSSSMQQLLTVHTPQIVMGTHQSISWSRSFLLLVSFLCRLRALEGRLYITSWGLYSVLNGNVGLPGTDDLAFWVPLGSLYTGLLRKCLHNSSAQPEGRSLSGVRQVPQSLMGGPRLMSSPAADTLLLPCLPHALPGL